METSIFIAFTTSVVALVVALISGAFTYYSTKRVTTTEKQKAYVQFLLVKMTKLEEVQSKFLKNDVVKFMKDLIPNSKINGKKCDPQLINGLGQILSEYDITREYLVLYSYLFTFYAHRYKELFQRNERLEHKISEYKLRSIITNSSDIKALIEKDGEHVLSWSEIFEEMVEIKADFKTLLKLELEETMHKFEELSTQ